MRHVCPKDVKMLMKQARLTCWRKWAAKQVKTKEEWTDKHRHVARKLVLEGAGCRKDSSTLVGQMKANAKLVTKRKGQIKHRLYH